MSNSLRPHGLQHTKLPCPSLSPAVCSNSCQWSYLTTSSSSAPFNFSFSRGSSWPRNWTCISCISRWILYHQATREVCVCVCVSVCVYIYIYIARNSNYTDYFNFHNIDEWDGMHGMTSWLARSCHIMNSQFSKYHSIKKKVFNNYPEYNF